MLIDQVNLNHLRIFESVFRTRSMTQASRELHLTQSGVSQHIKSLEEVLGVRLFDRINQRIVPTRDGVRLYELCSRELTEIERALFEIQGGKRELAGTVVIGMPIEFGNNVVLPRVTEFSRRYPKVSFSFKLDFASAMNEMLLRGEVDFAFVDEYAMDRRIETKPVYDEILELCVHPELLGKYGAPRLEKKYFEKLPYIAYQEDEPVLRMWFSHHLNTRQIHLDVKARLMDVQGVATLILNRMGVGILPAHLLDKLRKQDWPLETLPGSGTPVMNHLSLAWLRGRTQSAAAQEAFEFLADL